jgi:hypothetical protein
MYFSRDEKEAFKAGVRKGEKNADANFTVLRSSLEIETGKFVEALKELFAG